MTHLRSTFGAGVAEDVTENIDELPVDVASRLLLAPCPREEHPIAPGRVRFILKESAMPETRFAFDPQNKARAAKQFLEAWGDFVVGPLGLLHQLWHVHHAVQSIETDA